MKNSLNKIIFILTICSFFWIILCSFFFESNVYYSQNRIISFSFSLLILCLWFYLYKGINHIKESRINIKFEIITLSCFFILVTIIQFAVLKQLSVEPSWDFGVVFDNAYNFVSTGSIENAVYSGYFQYFPNNIMLFCLLIVFIKIGSLIGISALASAWVMNIAFIDLSLLLLYLVCRKKFSKKTGIFSLVIIFFFLPLFLYTPIFYSDTLSLFVGISLIYVFSFINNKNSVVKNIVLFILVGIIAFLGKEIKITSLFVLISLIFNWIVVEKHFKAFILPFVSLISMCIFIIVFNYTIVKNDRFSFQVNNYGSYPFTHWIMMGIEDKDFDNSDRNSYGGYNLRDYDLTRNFDTGKDAIKFNISEYIRRVKLYGFNGYIEYLSRKTVNAWTDGLYYSDVKLGRNPYDNNSSMRKLIYENNYTRYAILYFSQSVQFAFLILLILGSIFKFLKSEKEIDYVRMSILCIMFFLLFWENRSRYLVNFIPLFILIITEFYFMMFQRNNKGKIMFLKKGQEIENT